jgi:hypothetical protein
VPWIRPADCHGDAQQANRTDHRRPISAAAGTALYVKSGSGGVPDKGIPTYAAGGRRLRNHSSESIERCLALETPNVIVTRNRRTGKITSAQFRAAALEFLRARRNRGAA